MKQHQDYDKIFKENIQKIGPTLLQKLCGLELSELEAIHTTLPRTLERRSDFACLGKNASSSEKCVFHCEFQSQNHATMDSRMLFYFALYYELYRTEVFQYVFYMGTGNWTAPTQIQYHNISFSYQVVPFNQVDYEVFLNSETPEEIILAILGNFHGENKSEVVKRILKTLKSKTKNKKKLQKFIFQLEILANLRNLQPEIIKNISNMSIHYDITTDLRYQQGIEQGLEQGIEQGIEQGDLRRLKKMVRNLLNKGMLSLQEIAEAAEVDIDFVIAIQHEMQRK
jgi:predicted transposase/invertase (TIGR01784 family)